MRRALLVAAMACALAPAMADAAERRAVVGCAQQSSTGFPGAYRARSSLVVGPLAWTGARAAGDADGTVEGGFRWKFPALVRPGHTVTIRVGSSAAGFARLSYEHKDGWAFTGGSRTVVFRACSRAKAESLSDGRPVTFWSGGVVATQGSICLPVEIRVDRGPVRRRTIALNADC